MTKTLKQSNIEQSIYREALVRLSIHAAIMELDQEADECVQDVIDLSLRRDYTEKRKGRSLQESIEKRAGVLASVEAKQKHLQQMYRGITNDQYRPTDFSRETWVEKGEDGEYESSKVWVLNLEWQTDEGTAPFSLALVDDTVQHYDW